MTQNQRIITYLNEHGEITQKDAFKLGCFRLSARIHDLRAQGYDIKSSMRTVRNKDGSHSNIGVYSYGRK